MSNNSKIVALLAHFTASTNHGAGSAAGGALSLGELCVALPLAEAAAHANMAPMWSRSPQEEVAFNVRHYTLIAIAANLQDNWVFPCGSTVEEVEVALAEVSTSAACTRAGTPSRVSKLAWAVYREVREERDYAWRNFVPFNYEKVVREAMASHMVAWFR